MNNNNIIIGKKGGVSFIILLTCLLASLKLTGYVTLSWIWIGAPIWMSASFIIGTSIEYLFIIKEERKRKEKDDR